MAKKTDKFGKSKAPPFAMLQKAMIQSPGYRSLSFVARVVLIELLAQYNGKNNGDLSATRSMAKEWGIGSAHTLQRALEDLVSAGWVMQSRSSLFSKHGARCALYAIAWMPVNECPDKGLEIKPTRTPPRPLPTLINSIPSGAENAHVKVQKLHT